MSAVTKGTNAATPVLRDVGIIMVEMGLRPGEIFQLRHEDVRTAPPAPYVHVREGKSDRAVRDVPITSRALPVLNRRLLRAKGEYLFPRRVGNGYNWSRPMTELEPAHRRALRGSGIQPPSACTILDIPMEHGPLKRASTCSVWLS